MALSIDGNSYYNILNSGVTDNIGKTSALEKTLEKVNTESGDDKELLEACKSFESYFVEQVFKEMKKTVHSSDDEGEYMQYFGDMLTEQYAKNISDSGQLGIAQMLYESMKRN